MLQTGVLLRPGERVKISATVRWNAARFDKNQERQSGPDGRDPRQWPGTMLNFGQQQVPVGALVGKISQGHVFLVGYPVLGASREWRRTVARLCGQRM